MACTSDLTDEQWALLRPVFSAPSRPGRKPGEGLRTAISMRDGALSAA